MPLRQRPALALLALGLALVPSLVRAQAEEACRFTRTSGQVLVERGDFTGLAVVGVALQQADGVVTGSQARATIVCSDNLRITVGPDTRIGLDRLMRTAGAERDWPGIDLFRGVTGFIRSGSARGGFAVRTPSAVAAVRSTEWSVDATNNATAAFVRDGEVSVIARNRTAVLGPGEGVDVSANGIAGETREWGAARVEDLAARLGPDW